MIRTLAAAVCLLLLTGAAPALPQPARSGNPIFPGWYADPEAHVFQGEYWVYPTYSAPCDDQTFLDAFSSPDLATWKKHARILDIADVPWARRAIRCGNGGRAAPRLFRLLDRERLARDGH